MRRPAAAGAGTCCLEEARDEDGMRRGGRASRGNREGSIKVAMAAVLLLSDLEEEGFGERMRVLVILFGYEDPNGDDEDEEEGGRAGASAAALGAMLGNEDERRRRLRHIQPDDVWNRHEVGK